MTLYNVLFRHPFLTLLLMMVSALAVGLLTLNIFNLLSANWAFISRYGLMALREGAALQLLELIGTGFVSMLVYLLFKLTESVLVDWTKQRTWFSRDKNTDSVE